MINAWRRLLVAAPLALAAACSSPAPVPSASQEPSASPEPAATASPAAGARALIARSRAAGTWPGPNGLSGVNGDPTLDAAHVEAFCTARGRSCGIAHTYTDRSSYTEMTGGTAWTFDN